MPVLDPPTRSRRDARGFTVLPAPALLPRKGSWAETASLALPRTLDEHLARDPFPVPDTPDRENYHEGRHFDWWLSGLADYLHITRLLEAEGAPLRPGDGVLDLGCASGRTLRHFACQADGIDLWGCDINRRHIDFCLAFLGERVKAIVGTPFPSLPIPDASLALVYAFSVFTHIDLFETAWLAEIRRVLRPGGFAYLTIHSESTWSSMGPGYPIYAHLMRLRNTMPQYGISESLFRSPMPQPRIAFYMGPEPDAPCNVFHSSAYIKAVWERFLHVLRIIERPGAAQAGVLLQRP